VAAVGDVEPFLPVRATVTARNRGRASPRTSRPLPSVSLIAQSLSQGVAPSPISTPADRVPLTVVSTTSAPLRAPIRAPIRRPVSVQSATVQPSISGRCGPLRLIPVPLRVTVH
jgi:hypothetical protein